jgi:hypothetical protein
MEKSKKFVPKLFEEIEGGYYDEYNFYYTPNGSFWDEDGYYFNREGFDRHGGYYDDDYNYKPGEGWNKEKQCYDDEGESDMENNFLIEDDGDEEGEEDEMIGDVDGGYEDCIEDELDDDYYDGKGKLHVEEVIQRVEKVTIDNNDDKIINKNEVGGNDGSVTTSSIENNTRNKEKLCSSSGRDIIFENFNKNNKNKNEMTSSDINKNKHHTNINSINNKNNKNDKSKQYRKFNNFDEKK